MGITKHYVAVIKAMSNMGPHPLSIGQNIWSQINGTHVCRSWPSISSAQPWMSGPQFKYRLNDWCSHLILWVDIIVPQATNLTETLPMNLGWANIFNSTNKLVPFRWAAAAPVILEVDPTWLNPLPPPNGGAYGVDGIFWPLGFMVHPDAYG